MFHVKRGGVRMSPGVDGVRSANPTARKSLAMDEGRRRALGGLPRSLTAASRKLPPAVVPLAPGVLGFVRRFDSIECGRTVFARAASCRVRFDRELRVAAKDERALNWDGLLG